MSPEDYYCTTKIEKELTATQAVLANLVKELLTTNVPAEKQWEHRNRMSYWEGKQDGLVKALKYIRSKHAPT
jgi:hypothetical protein